MRLLLDSHAFIWAVDDPAKLGPHAALELRNPGNALLLSAATIWEIGIKTGLGKLTLSQPYLPWMKRAMADLGVAVLPITVEYADAQAALPGIHRDPFDRLLAAQCCIENVPIVSSDAVFDSFGVARVW